MAIVFSEAPAAFGTKLYVTHVANDILYERHISLPISAYVYKESRNLFRFDTSQPWLIISVDIRYICTNPGLFDVTTDRLNNLRRTTVLSHLWASGAMTHGGFFCGSQAFPFLLCLTSVSLLAYRSLLVCILAYLNASRSYEKVWCPIGYDWACQPS